MVIISQHRLDIQSERTKVHLIKYCLHKLQRGSTSEKKLKCIKPHTYRFKSELEMSGFAPTVLRKILDIISSLNITISWSKNLIRHGFDAKWILGILFFNLLVKLDIIGRRGSIELSVKSCGPGTSTKCVVCVTGGYCAMRSASALKPSIFKSGIG